MSDLLVVHGLRLRGRTTVGALVELYETLGLNRTEAVPVLERLEGEGVVRGRGGRWALTNPVGLRHDRSLVAAEVRAAGAEGDLFRGVEQFAGPNAAFLEQCSSYQLGGGSLSTTMATVEPLLREVQVVADSVAAALPRFSVHRPRLERAFRRLVDERDGRWMVSPLIDSVHTCWFELHEDLLTSAGIERGSSPS